MHPSTNASHYKLGSLEPGSYSYSDHSYYDHAHSYGVNDHVRGFYENRGLLVSSPIELTNRLRLLVVNGTVAQKQSHLTMQQNVVNFMLPVPHWMWHRFHF